MNAMQMQWEFGDLSEGRLPGEPKAFIAARLTESPTGTIRLAESICERENMRMALRRVEKNGGAPGIDGMKVSELRGYLRRHWPKIKADLLAGRYLPMPVRQKEIKKPEGGVRLLGIPTVRGYCTWVQSGFAIGQSHPSVSPAPRPAFHDPETPASSRHRDVRGAQRERRRPLVAAGMDRSGGPF